MIFRKFCEKGIDGFYMTIIEKIESFQSQLDYSDIKETRHLLLEIGKELKRIRRKELEYQSALIIFQIEYLLDDLNEIWFGVDTKFSEEVEDFFIELRGMAMNLAAKTEGQEIDDKYYFSVQKLGRKLINLSSMLK